MSFDTFHAIFFAVMMVGNSIWFASSLIKFINSIYGYDIGEIRWWFGNLLLSGIIVAYLYCDLYMIRTLKQIIIDNNLQP